MLPAGSRVLVTGGSGFIGGHLVGTLTAQQVAVRNLDVDPPWLEDQRPTWQAVDVRDRDAVLQAVADWRPTHVVHLAADVDASPDRVVADYAVNVDGTRHVLEAVASTGTAQRLLMMSTQFVCRPGHVPTHDQDWDPHTAYGQSKVLAEQLTRAADLGSCVWTIVRPTTIWGPGDDRYRRAFHVLQRRGWYRHPDVGPCLRSYGFVGNTVWQLRRLLELPATDVAGRVLYVGDPVRDVRDFVDAFSHAWHGRPAGSIPRPLAVVAARAGSVLGRLGLPAPVDQGRFDSLSTDYPVPLEPTFELLGPPPTSLEEGAAHTVRWLRGEADPLLPTP